MSLAHYRTAPKYKVMLLLKIIMNDQFRQR